jgi:hypothetical protein
MDPVTSATPTTPAARYHAVASFTSAIAHRPCNGTPKET